MLRVLILLAALSLGSARVAAAEAPVLVAEADTVQSDENHTWSAEFLIRNNVTTGLYADSLFLDIEDLDAGETRTPRRTTTSLATLVRLMQPIAAEDSSVFTYSTSTMAEHARLGFRMYLHDALGGHHEVKYAMVLNGGVLTDAFPSKLIAAANKRAVEVVAATPMNAAAPAPGILLVHGEAANARRQLRQIKLLADRGFGVVAVSQPGYGTSAGPADLAGPATLSALEAALGELKRMPGIDPKRIAVWGVGSGGTAALLLGAKHPELSTVIAQGASYDLWATYRVADAAGQQRIVADAGRDSAAWRARSPLMQIATIKCPVLVLHGEKDVAAPAVAAHAFVNEVLKRQGSVESKFVSDDGRVLSRSDNSRFVLDHLGRRFRH